MSCEIFDKSSVAFLIRLSIDNSPIIFLISDSNTILYYVTVYDRSMLQALDRKYVKCNTQTCKIVSRYIDRKFYTTADKDNMASS